ncbi:abortive infection system toxin AbiGii family protein [Metabacillus fastidiosus]|uniref:abortive infection system toxin AbiGii family protein n=1 Tax=Metabacillus fastidiosus TaxID=1458 RepID=UPI002DB936C1|nr:abortive infection system toxin AbiGii family protein [Metabacillus fastidiosus]MEC2078633.1 abortive infection system toxin AbiGii family protein [Metabacillus fastidiosus]
MFVNFENAFFKKKELDKKIPQEIINSLSENLPAGFVYTDFGNGAVGIKPKEDSKINFKGKIEIPDNLPKNFKPSTLNELLEFIYRTQQDLKIKLDEDKNITINGVKFGIDKLVSFPLQEIELRDNAEFKIIPRPFQPPFNISLEGNGIKKIFLIQRQPYADMHISQFKSVDNSAFEISYLLYESEDRLQFNFNLNIDNAKNVQESIHAFKLYEACIKGEVKICGESFPIPELVESEEESIHETIIFWEKVLKLEDFLQVKFTPKSKLMIEEVYQVEKLYKSLIEKEPFKEYINLKDMTFNKYEGVDTDSLVGMKDLTFQFIETSKIELLGVELDLHSISAYFDFIITDIQPLHSDNDKIKIIVTPMEGKKIYKSTLQYMSKEEVLEYQNQHFDISKLQNANLINPE